MDKLDHILVSLDGSELSEKALAAAYTLAGISNAEITLLRVLRPVEEVIKIDEQHAIYVDQQIEFKTRRAKKYLKAIRNHAEKRSLKINIVVEMGDAAEIIINFARKNSIDLIVMSTHGRSGLKRWVYGSVAGKILSGACNPVLLIRSYPEKEGEE
ncbi:MAG: universal stress protein [Deltaproteobacteria bacterium]|nr:universal stress protein [Deltaproteobacteria bacterium]